MCMYIWIGLSKYREQYEKICLHCKNWLGEEGGLMKVNESGKQGQNQVKKEKNTNIFKIYAYGHI